MQLLHKIPLSANELIIKTDKEKVYAILTNLVKNAIKYTHKGSVEFGYKKRNNQLAVDSKNEESFEIEFYVKDTGIGIPKERQNAIFERFIQADIDDKHAYQGAGLGLAICKAYAEMLGGGIWVESNDGNLKNGESDGSVFYFTLPYQYEMNSKVENENLPGKKMNTENIRNRTILIADDDEISALLLTNILQTTNHKIIHTKTGKEAIEICQNNTELDLILMDIQMPGINGYKATQEIRKFNKKIPIIAQTAFALAGDKEKAIKAGCDEYISKPIAKKELLSLLVKYFGKSETGGK